MSNPKPDWTALTHSLLAWARSNSIGDSNYGVALSGGRDSVLLLDVLSELASSQKLNLKVLHVHHGGPSVDRQKAQIFCAGIAEKRQLPFLTTTAEMDLKSEEELRQFRQDSFAGWTESQKLSGIFLAHHAEDLLETRLLRLIRGTGPQGLNAMQKQFAFSDFSSRGGYTALRPFLKLGRRQIDAEIRSRGLEFHEDVTNQDVNYQRNWMRHHWLPELEARNPGSVLRLSQSLDSIVEALGDVLSGGLAMPDALFVRENGENTVSRQEYLTLTSAQQKRCLALLLKRVKGADYSAAQIEEIQRRLDNRQNEHTFQVAGLLWKVDVRQIEAIKKSDHKA